VSKVDSEAGRIGRNHRHTFAARTDGRVTNIGVVEWRRVPDTGEGGGMRIGAKVPNSGPLPSRVGIPVMARDLEHAGFTSLWVSDHVVMPKTIESRYPFASDGKATWATSTPYIDAVVALTLIAGATDTVTFGTAVLVLPLRHPVVLAKQAASLDALSGGRLRLGIGAGWLEEEFLALDVPFATRGKRFVEWIEILRDCWTGTPSARNYEHYALPGDVLCVPTPVSGIPLLVGGHSPIALQRAGQLAEGWLAHQSLNALDAADVAAGVSRVRAAAADAGRDPNGVRVVLRVIDSAGRSDMLARHVRDLALAGVDELIVDVAWEDGSDHALDASRLLDAESAA
jgi:probable F420-dependent oxidoreductase